jgi:predicted SAM-dependent methyltransferase
MLPPHIFISRIPGLAFILFKIGFLSNQRYEQHQQGVFRTIRYLNVAKRFPYADATFDYIFSSHLFEHLYRNQAIFCLNETFRILKKGGVMRIAVPDLDRIVKYYDPQHSEDFLEAVFEAKQKHDKNKHHWHYNEISLTKLLKETGFSKIYR